MDLKLDKLAFRFFKLFAQYESSLKENGYFQPTKSGMIIVDWDRFVNERIGNNFIEKLGEKSNSANYILEYPPNKQAVGEDGKIIWVEIKSNDKSVQALFGHISRIRNNLYHGAKFNGTWFDPERSKILLHHGHNVLDHFKDVAGVRLIT